MALESCSLESSGRLLESVSNGRSRWMVIVSQETQDPAYRATLLHRLLLCVTSVCALIRARRFGSNWVLVKYQVPFALLQVTYFYGILLPTDVW